ncbi:hypothetical protein CEUSTIGMA_g3757.t1 [Chlamydomonas eustigma]|uniref:Uncharacterized protein n=1 Tax=Chlamydomonas eustigma TaxID=1157962 RepID=A0A250WZQ4_9CHLO|nr:hypothetical protein CEUSTIGMA_g3757.t1 [Chlamydomonas eustigma]|eukprot:GAX76311.1 hypothetical protein CEUSTIGMA_g3757.t1 [Chlamydomonas eustigma]
MEDLIDCNHASVKDQMSLSSDNIQAVVAFYKWRHSQLKAQFRRKVEEALEDISEEEVAFHQLKERHNVLNQKYMDLVGQSSAQAKDYNVLKQELQKSESSKEKLLIQVSNLEANLRNQEEQLRAATSLAEQERRHREEEKRRSGLELTAVQESLNSARSQHQQNLQHLLKRDTQVAELGSDLRKASQSIGALQAESQAHAKKMQEAETKSRANEEQANSRAETIFQLHEELSQLRERHMSELSELKMVRVAAAEVPSLKEQLAAAQSVAAAMSQARDEMQGTLGSTSAQLVSALEQVRRLQGACSVKEEVAKAFRSREIDGLNGAIELQVIAEELDSKNKELSRLAGEVSSNKHTNLQLERHVERLAAEATELNRQILEGRQQRDYLQRTVGEMNAEMQRLAAQAAVCPSILLSKELKIMRDIHGDGPASSEAQANPLLSLSAVETQATALRVLIADKSFGIRGLEVALSDILVPPSSSSRFIGGRLEGRLARLPEAELHLGVMRGHIQGMIHSLQVLCEEGLLARPLLAAGLVSSLQAVRLELRNRVEGLEEIGKGLEALQVEARQLSTSLGSACTMMTQCASCLSSWGITISQIMGQGKAVDDVLRHRMAAELKSMEGQMHGTLMSLAAVAVHRLEDRTRSLGTVAAGDQAYVELELGLRAVQNAVMELATIILDREAVSDSRVRAHLQHTESMTREKEGLVMRYKDALSSASPALAVISEKAGVAARDMNALAEGISVMLECLQEYLACNEQDRPLDPVALQGELLGLKARVRGLERELKEAANALGSDGNRGGNKHIAAHYSHLVPVEALRSLEAAHGEADRERAALRASMAAMRLRFEASRMAFVDHWKEMRDGTLQLACFTAWKGAMHASRAEATQKSLDVMQAAHDQLKVVCHHRRHAVVVTVMDRVCDYGKEQQVSSVIRGWRVQATRQACLRQHWCDLATVLVALERQRSSDAAHPDGATVALRLARRTMLFGPRVHKDRFRARQAVAATLAYQGNNTQLDENIEDGFKERLWSLPWSQELGLMVVRAWRSWARIHRSNRVSERLSQSVPLLVTKIGDRRRVERAWLSWRMWLNDRHVLRVEGKLEDQQELQAEVQQLRQLVLWQKQQQQAEAAEEEMEGAEESAGGGEDGEYPASLQLPVQPPGGVLHSSQQLAAAVGPHQGDTQTSQMMSHPGGSTLRRSSHPGGIIHRPSGHSDWVDPANIHYANRPPLHLSLSQASPKTHNDRTTPHFIPSRASAELLSERGHGSEQHTFLQGSQGRILDIHHDKEVLFEYNQRSSQSLGGTQTFIPHIHTILAPEPPLDAQHTSVLQQADMSTDQRTQPKHHSRLGSGKAVLHKKGWQQKTESGATYGSRSEVQPVRRGDSWHHLDEGPDPATSLSDRSRALASSVRRLAAGVRAAARSLSPPARSAPLHPTKGGSNIVKDSRARTEGGLRRRTSTESLKAELKMTGWQKHGVSDGGKISSPQQVIGGDSTRLSFLPQHQAWESLSKRQIDGTGTEAEAPTMLMMKTVPPSTFKFQTGGIQASQPTAVRADPDTGTAQVDSYIQNRIKADDMQPDKLQQADSFTYSAAVLQDILGSVPSQALGSVLQDTLGSVPSQAHRPNTSESLTHATGIPVPTVLPEALPPAHNYAVDVTSRVQEETVSSLAKKRVSSSSRSKSRKGGISLRGSKGAAALVHLPVLPPQPAMAPLTTYIPPRLISSKKPQGTSGPLPTRPLTAATAERLNASIKSGGVNGPGQLNPSISEHTSLVEPGASFDAAAAVGDAASSVMNSLNYMWLGAQTGLVGGDGMRFRIQPARGEVVRHGLLAAPEPVGLPGVGFGTQDGGQRFGEEHGGAGRGPIPNELKPAVSATAMGPSRSSGHMEGMGQGGGIGEVAGVGLNPRRVVRFDLASPVAGMSQTLASGSGQAAGSSASASTAVTFVRLPEPARFDISKLT